MRLLIKLKASKDMLYEKNYFHKLQGGIYGLIEDTGYYFLHEKIGYKFFCFSNIFPIPKGEKIITNESKSLLISSPDPIFITMLQRRLEEKRKIHIGEMEFDVVEVKKIETKIGKNLKLISATPIIIRIPEKNYEKYEIPKEFRKKRYVYWRPQYKLEAFVKQLEENLKKKYLEFYEEPIEIERIFEGFKFIKGPIVNHVTIHGKDQIFVGSLWEFRFNYLTNEQIKILKFGVDCGFGERNSLGFGFMNPLNKKQAK